MKSPLLRLRAMPTTRVSRLGRLVLDGQVPEEFGVWAQAVETLPAEEVADLYWAAVAGGAVVAHQRVLVHVRREDRWRDRGDQVGRVGAGDHPTWYGPDLAPR